MIPCNGFDPLTACPQGYILFFLFFFISFFLSFFLSYSSFILLYLSLLQVFPANMGVSGVGN